MEGVVPITLAHCGQEPQGLSPSRPPSKFALVLVPYLFATSSSADLPRTGLRRALFPTRWTIAAALACLWGCAARASASQDSKVAAVASLEVAGSADRGAAASDTVADLVDAAAVEVVDGPASVSVDCAAFDPDVTAPVAPFCPGPTQPAPDADTGDITLPRSACCQREDPLFFKGEPPPPQSLAITLGRVTDAGKFQTWPQGVWVPMEYGGNGGFHIWVAMLFALPGATEPKRKVQADVTLYDGCRLVGYAFQPTIYPVRQTDGTYRQGDPNSPGLAVRFVDTGEATGKSVAPKDACNRWFDVRVALRDLKSGAWGEATVRVRTYDTAGGKGGLTKDSSHLPQFSDMTMGCRPPPPLPASGRGGAAKRRG